MTARSCVLRIGGNALVGLLIWSAPLLKPAQAAEDPAILAKAVELMEVSGAEQAFTQMLPVIMKNIGQLIEKANPGRGAEVNDMLQEQMLPKVLNRASEMTDLIARVYAKHFTLAEMEELVAFYRTPVGQKLVREQPQMMQEAMQVGREWGQLIGQEVMEEIGPELEKRGLKSPPI